MSQKTDRMLKLALVFFISLLSFSIGTFVGKKYSDNQHKLAQLEPHKSRDVSPQEFAANSEGKNDIPGAARTAAEPLLTDNEVAKIAEEFASDTTDSDSSSNLTEKSIQITDSEEKDIKEITVGKIPIAKSKAAAKPVAIPAQTTAAIEKIKKLDSREVASIPNSNQYTVQVGSFPTQVEADKLSQDLVNKGYKSSSVSAQVNGQTWFRVQVGLFGTVKEAQDYKKDFLDKTKLSSAIVQRVQK